MSDQSQKCCERNCQTVWQVELNRGFPKPQRMCAYHASAFRKEEVKKGDGFSMPQKPRS
jgi:hypothetical protein